MPEAETRGRHVLSRLLDVRPPEIRSVTLMFGYAFSVMTAYNLIQPVTRSAFISDLGADNLPYVLLVAGVLVGFMMQAYTALVRRLPPRWALPMIQAALAGALVGFFLLLQTGRPWVTAAFYVFGQILGTLLLSQFWTLANEFFDPRQARRLFGLIGGGASLGGMAGSGLAALLVQPIGTDALVLASAVSVMTAVGMVTLLLRSKGVTRSAPERIPEPIQSLRGAWQLVRETPSLRHTTMLIACAALGAMLVDQQLSLAAEQFRGGDEDAVTAFLASVRFLLSTVSLVIQVVLVTHIYRLLGVGFAVVLLPVSLGATAITILLTGALWAPVLASVIDRAIRYTVDRTTREIFFMPVAPDVRQRVKSFLDVTVDRAARAGGALVVLVAIQPWGLSLSWPALSVITLALVAGWLFVALRARDHYVEAIRQLIQRPEPETPDVQFGVADLTTVEALLEELADPDEQRALNAIDMLDSLDKRNLVTPLLLYHRSAPVRARALRVMADRGVTLPPTWRALVQRMVDDPDPEVRAGAILALASVERTDATRTARRLIDDVSTPPRMAVSAAVVLASSPEPTDVETAELTLTRLVSESSASAAIRRDVAQAIRRVDHPRIRQLLIPLLQDPDTEVAQTAMRAVRSMKPPDRLFVPTLVSLLADRRLKSGARDSLVSYGPVVLPMLGHVLTDPGEDLWVRRHVPSTIGHIPGQAAMDLLVGALDEPDAFLRDKAISGMHAIRRRAPAVAFPREPVERLLARETRRYFRYLTLRQELFDGQSAAPVAVLSTVLAEELIRAVQRSYRLLALLHPWKDIAGARWAIEHGTATRRAQAFEYLDNILPGDLRRTVLPMLEDLPLSDKVGRGYQILRTHPRGTVDALLSAINDDDEVVAAASIDLVRSGRHRELVEDVEHVLAHRDARDWLVFEAASWALAEFWLTESGRRARWLEPLPAIVLADRLRRLSMFGAVTVDELCRLAVTGRQVRHESREALMREGTVPELFHVLLDGQAKAQTVGSETRMLEAPALVGFESALEGRPASSTVWAAGACVTLAVSREDLLTLLTGNTDFLRGLFRTLAETLDPSRTLILGPPTSDVDPPVLDLALRSHVSVVHALQQVPLFASLPVDELTQLAAATHPVALEPASVLADETDPPAVYVVLSGRVSLRDATSDATRGHAGAGDVVGLFETLAGQSSGAGPGRVIRLQVEDPGWGLKVEPDDLFDLLEYRPVLLQHLFGAVLERGPRER